MCVCMSRSCSFDSRIQTHEYADEVWFQDIDEFWEVGICGGGSIA